MNEDPAIMQELDYDSYAVDDEFYTLGMEIMRFTSDILYELGEESDDREAALQKLIEVKRHLLKAMAEKKARLEQV